MGSLSGKLDSGRGRFIVLDGIDGCGKSTQALRLRDELARRSPRTVHHLREPGSTAVGEQLRGLLLAREHALSPAVETLLFAAARRQMLDELVAPALARGEHVVCERSNASTFAYQAVAGRLDPGHVLELLVRFANDPAPDLVLVLDLPVEVARARRADASDRIEDKGMEFQRAVREGFLRFARTQPRVLVLDASAGEAQVAAQVLERALAEVQRAL